MQNIKRTKKLKLTSRLFTYVLAACVVMLSGCANTQQRETMEQIRIKDKDVPEVMEIAEDVLAKMHFTIDKADDESGYIRTRPLPGGQFFEFWRCDNIGADNFLESNLHTIRRTAELQVSRPGEDLIIDCNVYIERLSLPERNFTGTDRAYSMSTRSKGSLRRLNLTPYQEINMAWIDLGKDDRLTTEILRRIEDRLQRQE
jgi:hypothetical protein